MTCKMSGTGEYKLELSNHIRNKIVYIFSGFLTFFFLVNVKIKSKFTIDGIEAMALMECKL